MADIKTTDIVTELGAYFRTNNTVVKNMVYQQAQVFKYTKPVTKVKGQYPAPHSVLGHVVQGFTDAWAELGEVSFKANILTAYHQKVNMPITPSKILNTWLAELYTRGVKPSDMPISKYIVEKELMPRVVADIEYLAGNGVYDTNTLSTFGSSMDGLIKILQKGIADSSMYKIPVAPLTATNIVDQVESFEDAIPKSVRSMITKIYMSTRNRDRYRKDYRNQFGANNDFGKEATTKTYTGNREIIGLDCMDGSDLIFATPDENFLQLIDAENIPAITDIQILDYKVKIFMEWWLGIAFYMNQLVLVSVTPGSGSGLASDQDLYFSSSDR